MVTVVTDKTHNRQRLDKLLCQLYPALSRAKIQKAIGQGLVTVDNKHISPHYFLKEKQSIVIDEEKLLAEEIKERINPPTSQEPVIMEETDDYLIIDKPAGWVVHPAASSPKDQLTVSDWLSKKYPELKNIGPDQTRGGIVHRLDKDVSGVLLVARTLKFYGHIIQQFKDRVVDKTYLALVHEQMPKSADVIDFPIVRGKKGKMAAKPKNEDGKEAITRFTVIKNYDHFSYLEVKIDTGRTHQIRVHLRAYSHPIVGDRLYEAKRPSAKLITPRLFLHAHQLSFIDMDGNKQTYTSPLPPDLKAVLESIKK
ncbi:MAG: RluA family pseudouridine synthase [bacterium]